MPDLGKRITFVELLNTCHRIEVPLLQRDYAQGRESAKEIRDGFLDALQDALLLPRDDVALPLNLDFVYGSMEENGGKYFLPLDGQQRLTTLFLLHWYLAWRDGESGAFKEIVWSGRHSRFSYAVRPSSAEFFDELVQYTPDCSPDQLPSVRRLIENQHWFYLHWRLDPTIQSALTMLDAIHGRFRDHEGFFGRMLDKDRPAITFQLLPLEHFGLSDDLYIKMNARGKPLTDFETFKARFEQHLRGLYPTETRQIGDASLPVDDFFSRRMDTRWADFFWSHRAPGTALFDAAVMNLFWIVALASMNPDDRAPAAPVVTYRSDAGTYREFDELGLLTRGFADNLMCLLEAWSSDNGQLQSQLPDARYFDETAFFKKASKAPQSVQYSELVQFAAFALYLSTNEGATEPQQFQEWMRVIFNLVQNSDIERPDDYERSVSGLRKLLPHSRDILQHLANAELGPLGFSRDQVQEESLKAKLLLAHRDWRNRIDAAEAHGYFRGQIGFLIEFAGICDQADEHPVEEWPDEQHATLQQKFDEYLEKATVTFNAKGLAELPGEPYQWERALLAIGDYFLRLRSNRSFLTSQASNYDSWKRFLRSGHGRKYLKQMWDRLDVTADLASQLAEVRNATGLEPWRAAFVAHPEAMEYCGQNELRWTVTDDIYLLRRKQMNGTHAELFTYCLFQRVMNQEGMLSFLVASYESVMGTYEEPHITLRCRIADATVMFDVHYATGQYRISTLLLPDQPDSELQDLLQEDGFSRSGSFLQKHVPPSEIEVALRHLDEILNSRYGGSNA